MSSISNNKFNWSAVTTKTLINAYRDHELLYNPKHPHYKSRRRRMYAYKCIADKISTIREGCTIENLKRKINGLRSQYLAERTKVSNVNAFF